MLLLRTVVFAQILFVFIFVVSDTTSECKSFRNRTVSSFVRRIRRPPVEWRALFKTKKSPVVNKQDIRTVNAEATMTTAQIISNRGYPVETHTVNTDDGYILEMHRIPRSKSTTSTSRVGKPVFLMHGLTTSDADWVISPSDRSLAFRLADLGYDVWMGNARGNIYSRKHVFLDPSGETFWNFSWDEIGKYDIPAELKYVLATNGASKLSYIGHSMGSAVFFIAMITNPSLNSKVEAMFALGPASSLAHMRSPLRFATPFVVPLQIALRLMQTRAFFTRDDIIPVLQHRFCNPEDRHLIFFCRNVVFALVDDNLKNIDPALWSVMDGHVPAGTSVRTVAQFVQGFASGETFQPFSYGWLRNLRKYGRITPPPYDLSQVTAPVYIYYGPNDSLVGPEDASWLAGKLGNCKALNRVDLDGYNHFDFLWGDDNNRLLYNSIIANMPSAT